MTPMHYSRVNVHRPPHQRRQTITSIIKWVIGSSERHPFGQRGMTTLKMNRDVNRWARRKHRNAVGHVRAFLSVKRDPSKFFAGCCPGAEND